MSPSLFGPFERPQLLAVPALLPVDPGPEAALLDADPLAPATPPARPGPVRPLRPASQRVPSTHNHVSVRDRTVHAEFAGVHTDHDWRVFCHHVTRRLAVLAED